jgi:hypothetical protein
MLTLQLVNDSLADRARRRAQTLACIQVHRLWLFFSFRL